jgi:hypothetical protein
MLYVSKNGVAIVLLLATLFRVEINEQLAADIASAVGLLVSVALMLWNQFGRRDISWGIFKK